MEASGQRASATAPMRRAKAYWASTSATCASPAAAFVASCAAMQPQHVGRPRGLVAAIQRHGHERLEKLGLLD